MVSDDESYYGESSLYSFIAGRHNSLLRKFKEAWLGVNEFRDTSIFKDIAEIFVILRGDVGATSENIKNFLNSILLLKLLQYKYQLNTEELWTQLYAIVLISVL